MGKEPYLLDATGESTSKSTRDGRSMPNSTPDAKTLPDKSDDLAPALADLVIH